MQLFFIFAKINPRIYFHGTPFSTHHQAPRPPRILNFYLKRPRPLGVSDFEGKKSEKENLRCRWITRKRHAQRRGVDISASVFRDFRASTSFRRRPLAHSAFRIPKLHSSYGSRWILSRCTVLDLTSLEDEPVYPREANSLHFSLHGLLWPALFDHEDCNLNFFKYPSVCFRWEILLDGWIQGCSERILGRTWLRDSRYQNWFYGSSDISFITWNSFVWYLME